MPNRFCEHCGAPMAAAAAACPQCGIAAGVKPAGVEPTGQGRRTWRDPVVLVLAGCGCLALVPIAGIVAAILIPNFLDALHKGRQNRTVADLRTMAAMLIATSAGGETGFPEAASFGELKTRLGETAAEWPDTDAWEHPYRYQCWAERAATGCDTFRLASPGRDGTFGTEDLRELTQSSFLATDYHQDIVIADFGWVSVPDIVEDLPDFEELLNEEEATADPDASSDDAHSDDSGSPGAAPEGEDAGDGQH